MLTPEMEITDTRIGQIRAAFITIIGRYYGEKITQRLLVDICKRLRLFLIDNRFNVFVDIGLRIATGEFEIIEIRACFPEDRGVEILAR